MHLTVKITREFRIRMAMGLALIKLAAKIMGIGIEVNRTIAKPDG